MKTGAVVETLPILLWDRCIFGAVVFKDANDEIFADIRGGWSWDWLRGEGTTRRRFAPLTRTLGKRRQKPREANKKKQITVDRKEKQGKGLSPFVQRIKYIPQKKNSEDWLTIRKDSKTTQVEWVSTHILYITCLYWLSNSGIIKIIIQSLYKLHLKISMSAFPFKLDEYIL